jgi:membrane-associated protease RseP (regulator of RpoE activity)
MFIQRRFPRVIILALILVAQGTLARAGESKRSDDASLFSESEFLANVSYLASDELEGRGTGQEGGDAAAEYIAKTLASYGVQPAGDDGTFFANFTLKLQRQLGKGTRLAFAEKGRATRRPARLGKDYTPFHFSSSGRFAGPVVFAGYGIVSDDQKYNDYDGLEVADKVVLVLRRAPKFAEFPETDMTFRAKSSRALARDAAALLVVNTADDEDGDKLFEFDKTVSFERSSRSHGLPMMHITPALANRLLAAGGMKNIAAIQEQIESTKAPVSGELKGVTVRGTVEIEKADTPVKNVVGIIPGEGPQADEIILLGAHYDHLGIRNKGMPEFNSERDISNGADDNASGTSAIMMLAKAFSQGKKPNRSIAFAAFTGEELGLLGSAAFAKNPTIDLKKCITMLNFDMVGRLKDNKLDVGGMGTGGFEEMVKRLAKPYSLNIKNGGGGVGPSDHTSFYNKDIPVLFFFTGIHKQYHQPDDDTPLLNLPGAISVTRFAADIIDEIDANKKPPKFKHDMTPTRLATQDGAERRRPDRPRLGVRVDEDSTGKGALLAEVMEDSIAYKAGVREGDRILRIGKTDVIEPMDVRRSMRDFTWGDSVTIEVQRGGKRMEFLAKLGEKKVEAVAKAEDDPAIETISTMIKQFITASHDLPATVTIHQADASVTVKLEPGNPPTTASLRDSLKKITFDGDKPWRLSYDLTFDKDAKPAKKAAPTAAADNPHGPADETGEVATMPRVRLGIMPSYGESEGEGYEISGVMEDGPAAKAGMKDNDRILKIGDADIKDVYTYMDALRKYKPGDEITVVVLRDDKKVTLKIKAGEPKAMKEAA